VLRCILRHCGVPVSTPHSSGFARLEFEAFYFVARFPTFYGTINFLREEERKSALTLLSFGFKKIQLLLLQAYAAGGEHLGKVRGTAGQVSTLIA